MGTLDLHLAEGAGPLSWLKRLCLGNGRTSQGSPWPPSARNFPQPLGGSGVLTGSPPDGSPSFLSMAYPSAPQDLQLHVLYFCRADTHRVPCPPGTSQSTGDVHTFLHSSHDGQSPVMTGTSCASMAPSTPQRRSSWLSRRPCPTRNAPSSWCPTRWQRRIPEAQSERVVSAGNGDHRGFPQA